MTRPTTIAAYRWEVVTLERRLNLEGAVCCASVVVIHFSQEEPMAQKAADKMAKQAADKMAKQMAILKEMQRQEYPSTFTISQMVSRMIEHPNYNELELDQKLTQLTQILGGKQGGNLSGGPAGVNVTININIKVPGSTGEDGKPKTKVAVIP